MSSMQCASCCVTYAANRSFAAGLWTNYTYDLCISFQNGMCIQWDHKNSHFGNRLQSVRALWCGRMQLHIHIIYTANTASEVNNNNNKIMKNCEWKAAKRIAFIHHVANQLPAICRPLQNAIYDFRTLESMCIVVTGQWLNMPLDAYREMIRWHLSMDARKHFESDCVNRTRDFEIEQQPSLPSWRAPTNRTAKFCIKIKSIKK